MNSIRRLSTWTGILLILFLLSGCTGRPVLTKENSYSIIKVSPEGEIQKIPIELTWNSNAAVMQELLLEASFVLSDLHTQMFEEIENANGIDTTITSAEVDSLVVENLEDGHQEGERNKTSSTKSESSNRDKQETPEAVADSLTNTILLEANFPHTKKFNLTIDNEQFDLDVSSIQIEVDGENPGRVILNQVLTLQGIPNPNLKTAYDQYTEMLMKIKREARR